MRQLTIEHLLTLLTPTEPPCLSLYQPTHRHHPDNQQDPIRFKNLLKQLEESLRQKYPSRDVRALVAPFQELVGNAKFWNHTWDGLAVLAGAGVLEVFHLQRPVPELAVVAESFHVKPLLRYLQSADRFHVLALSRDQATVYSGNRYVLDAETLPEEFPAQLEQVVPPERGEPGVAVASAGAGVGGPKMLRGHDQGKFDVDTEKFFRAVDQAVTARFSKPAGVPLVLAALPEHQPVFRRISQNTLLLADGVAGNPKAYSAEELRRQVWQVLEPHYVARLERLKENFRTAQARHAGSSDLSDVARAAVAGRVGTLLVESERVIPGLFDKTTGAIASADLAAPEAGDLLDALAELVLRMKGEVVVVPAERMPTPSGLAAIYRF